MFDCCSTFVGFNLSQSWYFRDPYKIEYRQWNLIYSTFGIVNDILSIDMNLYLISTHSLPRDVVLCNGDHMLHKNTTNWFQTYEELLQCLSLALTHFS